MKIDNYIIRGGENLNSAAKKTPSFPRNAELIFNDLHTKLGKDDSEKENYFETPVDELNRLFIRSFYVEIAGNRPICFFVGLLIPRTAYIQAKDYYCLHKGLCSVSLDQIQAAISSFRPIEVTIDWPIPRTPIGLDFQQLSQMKLYGEKEYSANINQMCLSISINTIDDWFLRLFIAVNPYRMSRAFTVVVSRDCPRPPMPDDKPFIPVWFQEKANDLDVQDSASRAIPSGNQDVGEQKPLTASPIASRLHCTSTKTKADSESPLPASSNKIHFFFYTVLVVALFVCLYKIYSGGSFLWRDYHRLKDENRSLVEANRELEKRCKEFATENANIDKELRRLDDKVTRLITENNKLKAELSRLKSGTTSSQEKSKNWLPLR